MMQYKAKASLACVAIFCVLIAAVVGDGHDDSCADDKNECLMKMKEMLLKTDLYWFGSSFPCDDCDDPAPMRHSIMSRLLELDDAANATFLQSVANGLEQVVDITYNADGSKIYGCDHYVEIPPVYRFVVDPMKVADVSTFSLQPQPLVRWKGKDNTLQTVVIWDAAYFYLHGIFLNTRDGQMETGTAVYPYGGPKNSNALVNPYLFVVFDQLTYLDPGAVSGALWASLAASELQTTGAKLLALAGGALKGPVAGNILNNAGDIWSTQYMKNIIISDSCPMFASEIPAVKQGFENVGIDAGWVPEIPFINRKPFLPLSVAMTVEYDSKEIEVQSCCVESRFTWGMFRANPFSDKAVPAVMARDQPRVQWSAIQMTKGTSILGKIYTLMMVDITDALIGSPNPNINVHWLVTDIKDTDVNSGSTILSYVGPNPFSREGDRYYMFMLLEQNDESLDLSKWSDYVSNQCPPFLSNRCGAKLGGILREWGLEKRIAGITWFTARQDAYVRKQLYEVLYVKPKYEVCDGLRGYEEPCPRFNAPCTSAANSPFPALTALVLSSVLALWRM